MSPIKLYSFLVIYSLILFLETEVNRNTRLFHHDQERDMTDKDNVARGLGSSDQQTLLEVLMTFPKSLSLL